MGIVGRPLYDRTGDNSNECFVLLLAYILSMNVGATKEYMGSVRVGPK